MVNKILFPALRAQLVDINMIEANHYNPNKMAKPELDLLTESIMEDGVTQPLVCYSDKKNQRFILIDGFHRFIVLKDRLGVKEVPIVILDKKLEERIASTVRHNRAKGTHTVDQMANLVAYLTQEGWSEQRISKELGMEQEEIVRFKQQRGLKSLFINHEFSKSWVSFEEKYYKKNVDI